jgi:hypothetical protein
MDKKLLKYGYSIPEAAEVFTFLPNEAAERRWLPRGLLLASILPFAFQCTANGAFNICLKKRNPRLRLLRKIVMV